MVESSDIEPSWRNVLRLDDVPWLRDHKIVEDIVFPAAGYIAAVGEAIRQMTGDRSYSVRRLVVKSACVLKEEHDIELVTSFKPMSLTDSLESEWFDFTIASYDEGKWTKHCSGKARAGTETPDTTSSSVNVYPRSVQPRMWYSAMNKVGLNYGARFQGLQSITASPAEPNASAIVQNRHDLHESSYSMHPTTIDQTLQLFTVAISNGLARRLDSLAIPAAIGDLYISDCGSTIAVEAKAQITPKGAIHGSATAISGGKLVLSLQDSIFNPLVTDKDESKETDNLAAARLEWKPDISFAKIEQLIRPQGNKNEALLLIEAVAILCMIETSILIRGVDISSEHLRKYQSWLNLEVARMQNGEYHWLPAARQWVSLSSEERGKLLDKKLSDACNESYSPSVTQVLRTVLENCNDIFHGRVSGIELLLPNNGLTSIYNLYQDMVDFRDFLELLGHSQPNMRILEIGAGTGGTTAHVLEALQSNEGVRLFSTYHYTDISAGFFSAAKDRFKHNSGLEFSVLDISEDIVKQGFEAESYDVVISSNVLHATPNLCNTLKNVRQLLAPGGRLFLQELNPNLRWTNYIMGILPGWWLGEFDNRPTQPFVSPARWHEELCAAGFSGVDTVVYDNAEPLQINANIVSTSTTMDIQPELEVSLLYQGTPSSLAEQAGLQFAQEGYKISWITLDDDVSPGSTIIMFLDLDTPFLHDLSPEKWRSIQGFFSRCSSLSQHLIWVSRFSQVRCSDPSYGLLPGFTRTLRSELSLDLATFEAEMFDATAWKALVHLSKDFKNRRRTESIDPDYEYAFYDGLIHTSRFHWITSDNEKLEVQKSENVGARLEVGKYGLLSSLSWSEFTRKDILQGDEVEIQIRSVGLNFRDVLVSMGIVDGSRYKLGLEGAGVVSRIAPGVNSVNIGDRVLICDLGCLATEIVTSEKLCAVIPDRLSFEDAATMPCVYSTVIYALIHMGGLEKGQSVLIHSACGGVGIAAIQICQMLGADIYATVGNDVKVQYLVDTFKIPRDRIFDSRNVSFLPSLMEKTGNKGVDLVLNSLSGELLHASWKCVAPFGKMLEIGKRDFIGHAQLAMDIFAANRSFVGIDLAQLTSEKPRTCQRLLKQCLTYYRQGEIEPIHPIKAFPATQAVDAFRYMQAGQHIGKIVINMPDRQYELQAQPKLHNLHFSPNASYLLVGGLGGLGRAVSVWMVERGARNLVYLSRSAGISAEDKNFFRELEAQECHAVAVAGSVTSLEDVHKAIALATKPIAGIIQLSMVLRDQSFLQMTHEEWKIPSLSKVQGTWNLHKAFENTSLDFFLLFSSLSGTVGQRGQSNYAAANTFLDSFVQYRHTLGLPASVIDVGVMEDVGYVSQNAAVLEMFRAYNMHGLREIDLLRAIEIAIGRSKSTVATEGKYCNLGQLTIGLASNKSLLDPSNRSVWKNDARMTLYRNRESEKQFTTPVSGDSDGLKEFLASVASNPAMLDETENKKLLTHEIAKRIGSFMIQSEDMIDVKMSFSDIGIDSLVSIEIRNWWRVGLGLDISVLEIMNAGSIDKLGVIAADSLRSKHEPKEGPHPALGMKAP